MESKKSTAQKTSFVKQAAILAIAGLIVRFIGFLYRIPITNLIGDKGNAYYAAGYNLYTLFLIISSAGLPAAISKMVSERSTLKKYRDAHSVFRVALYVSGSMGLASALFLWFGADWLAVSFKVPESYASILTLAPTVFIVAILAVYRGYFQGYKNTIPTAISQVVEQIFNGIFSVYLAYLFVSQSVALGAAGGTAGTGIGALLGLVVIVIIYIIVKPVLFSRIKKQTTKPESSKAIAFELLSTALPIIIGTAIFSISNTIDMIMVNDRLIASGAFSKETVDALYGQLTGKYVTLTTLPVSIATTLGTVAVPNIAASVAAKDKQMVQNKINLSLRLAMILSIPAAVGIGVLGDQILLLLFPDYPEGGILLQFGSVSIIFLALAQILTGILQGTGNIYIPVIAALFGALLKIPLNYYLIAEPTINVLGAVISTTGCYALASTINFFMVKRKTGIKPDLVGAFVKPVFASAIMGLACYVAYYSVFLFYPSNILSTCVSIVVGIAVYFTVMLFINGITKSDLKSMPMGNKLIKLINKFGF